MNRRISILIISLLANFSLSAQFRNDFNEKTSIGFGLGTSSYLGDLGSGDEFKDVLNMNFSAQFRLSQKHSNVFTTDVNLLLGSLDGDDATATDPARVARNLRFKSRFIELGVYEEVHVLNLFFKKPLPVSPYLIAGASAFNFNPTAVGSDFVTYSLRDLSTEGQGYVNPATGQNIDPVTGETLKTSKYSLLAMSLGLGGGLKFQLSDKVNLKFEGIMKFTSTDYLDDVSSRIFISEDVINALHPTNPAIVKELVWGGKTTRPSDVRGSSSNDLVFNLFLTASYNIGNIFEQDKIQCYEF